MSIFFHFRRFKLEGCSLQNAAAHFHLLFEDFIKCSSFELIELNAEVSEVGRGKYYLCMLSEPIFVMGNEQPTCINWLPTI